jgi:uncharacterized protein YdhG (YjbR/CyaY superfamily)
MTVDEFICARVLPELQPVATFIRRLVKEFARGAVEDFSYDMPLFRMRHIVAYFIPKKENITFSFTYGVRFEDTNNLLRGRGKHDRYVKIRDLKKVNIEALKDYIQQAVEIDGKTLPWKRWIKYRRQVIE